MIHPPARSSSRLLVAALVVLGLRAGPAAADSYPRQTAVDVLHYDIGSSFGKGATSWRGPRACGSRRGRTEWTACASISKA